MIHRETAAPSGRRRFLAARMPRRGATAAMAHARWRLARDVHTVRQPLDVRGFWGPRRVARRSFRMATP